ncbi:hypothetical protein [Allorhizobium ampelinum]|nr:hypothetical protein [Allorhizobium ampelinum]
MGEAKRKKLLEQPSPESLNARRMEMVSLFHELNIDFRQPGFYDQPNFVAQEQKDKRFAENYAEWVLLRERNQDYDARAQAIVPQVAAILQRRIVQHNWHGACIAMTAILTRILDRLGIWNIPVRGSASVYAEGSSRHFAIIDQNEGTGFDTGHMWVIAPPYDIIDVTLHYQRWQGDAFQRHVPVIILGKGLASVKARAQDVIAPELRSQMPRDPDIHYKVFPDQRRVLEKFPAKRFISGSTDIRYVPGGVSLPDLPLEGINEEARAGVPGIQIWTDDILPTLGTTA